MALGVAAMAGVRLIVWSKKPASIRVEPDPAEMAARYGADTGVLDWRHRLVCSQCADDQAVIRILGNE
jgi:hypothetical protein